MSASFSINGNEAEIRKALGILIEPGAVFEVRAPKDAQLDSGYKRGPISGYFDNIDACLKELHRVTAAEGVYLTLNPVDPALLARRKNRLDYAPSGTTTSDQHVRKRRWLLIDLDYERPSGISATNAEKESAKDKAREMFAFLEERGWPHPVVTDSGNGTHLLYRVDLPSNDERLLEKLLRGLAEKFNGNGVKIDRSVFNPARITKLYGTLSAKGDSTVERPHRLSKVLVKGSNGAVVTREQLEALANELTPPAPEQPVASNGLFDMEDFLSKHGIGIRTKRTLPDGRTIWILDHCPRNNDHTGTSVAVMQTPDGMNQFSCKHDSCQNVTWSQMRAEIDPEYALKKAEWKPSPKISNLGELATTYGDGDAITSPPAPYVPPPLDLLPAAAREYVLTAAAALNQDVSFILLPLLSALGSAIGNSRSILLKRGFTQPPVIWTGIIGCSGQGKSPAINDGCFAVMERERELMRQNKETSTAYDEELATWEAKGRKDRGIKPMLPASLTCLMDDMTLEALADTIQQNPRGVLVKKDELSHWLASFDQYHAGKGSDVSRWLSLHTAMFFGIDRRTDHRRYRIPNPRVCITGGIQPRVLARALTEDFFERGLPARFLFAAPPSRQDRWREDTIPDRVRDDMLELFDKLWLLQPERDSNDNPQPVLLTLEADAKREFVAYYNECGASAVDGDDRTEAAWNKLSGYAARLALIGQLATDPNATRVTGEAMKAACDLARWFGTEALRIYASMAETPGQREGRKLVEFIESRGGLVSVRDVTHCNWAFRAQADKAEQALNALVKQGLGQWLEIKPEGRGRPTRKFQLLQASPSPKIPQLRGETPNYGDGEVVCSQKNTEFQEPDNRLIEEAKLLFNTAQSGDPEGHCQQIEHVS